MADTHSEAEVAVLVKRADGSYVIANPVFVTTFTVSSTLSGRPGILFHCNELGLPIDDKTTDICQEQG